MNTRTTHLALTHGERMSETDRREYSVQELNTMRQALLTILTRGRSFVGSIEHERALYENIESRLRTHILAETDPEDLVKEAGGILTIPFGTSFILQGPAGGGGSGMHGERE